MAQHRRTIAEYMTPSPHTIGPGEPLAAAHRLMRAKRVRHLPVVRRGLLVGIVSLGDLHFIETLDGVDAETVAVEEAMTRAPYVVAPDTPLRQAARRMAADRLGSAVVATKGKIIGVFTTVDALRALAELA